MPHPTPSPTTQTQICIVQVQEKIPQRSMTYVCKCKSMTYVCKCKRRSHSVTWHIFKLTWTLLPPPHPTLTPSQMTQMHILLLCTPYNPCVFLLTRPLLPPPHPTLTPPQMTQMHILLLCTPYNPCVFKLTWTLLPPPHPTPNSTPNDPYAYSIAGFYMRAWFYSLFHIPTIIFIIFIWLVYFGISIYLYIYINSGWYSWVIPTMLASHYKWGSNELDIYGFLNGILSWILWEKMWISCNQLTRRRTARERRGAGSSLVSMETQY